MVVFTAEILFDYYSASKRNVGGNLSFQSPHYATQKPQIYESSLIALEEVKARNGMAIGFVEQGNSISELMDYSFHLPEMMKDFVPFYELVIAQLFAYYSALYLNRNIDKPRNLAKSVTVQ